MIRYTKTVIQYNYEYVVPLSASTSPSYQSTVHVNEYGKEKGCQPGVRAQIAWANHSISLDLTLSKTIRPHDVPVLLSQGEASATEWNPPKVLKRINFITPRVLSQSIQTFNLSPEISGI